MNLMSMNTNEVKTVSSLEIAELTGKRHDNVMTDIRKIFEDLEIQSCEFLGDYKDSKGRVYKCFNLTEELTKFVLYRYKGLNKVPHRLREEAALKAIEQILGVTLIRQYKVLKYKIDGYDVENNVAYEIDEESHKYSEEKDSKREEIIKKVLGCTFKRIKL